MAKNKIAQKTRFNSISKFFKIFPFFDKKNLNLFFAISSKLLILLTALSLLLFLVPTALTAPDKFQLLRLQIFKNSQNPNLRLELISVYLENHQYDLAQKEIDLLIINQSVLSPDQKGKLESLIQKKVQSDPSSIEKQIEKWQFFIQKYPRFPYAYLQLALLHYRLGDFEKSSQSLKKAQELSPNNENIAQLEKILSNSVNLR